MPLPGTLSPRRLAAGVGFGLLIVAAAAARPAAAQVQLAEALNAAETHAERVCLAEATKIGSLITLETGEMPEDSSDAEALHEIVADCEAGRIDEAMDKRAVLWASLTLHQRHKS